MAMTPQQLQKSKEYQRIFYKLDVVDKTRIEAIEFLQKCAEEDPEYDRRCVFCKKQIVYVPFEYGLCEGHVYSEAGMRDVEIARCCEYCFDEAHKDLDE